VSIGNPPSIDLKFGVSLSDCLVEIQREINKRKRPIYIPATHFSGFYNTTGGTIQFAGSGNPQLADINGLGIVGARFEALNDSCHHLFRVPVDFNVDTNLRVEVEWCTSSPNLASTVTWVVRYFAIADGEIILAASTALDTVITSDNVLGSYRRAVTPSGFINGGNLEHNDLIHFNVILSEVSGLNPATDQIFLLGLSLNDEE